MLISSLPKNSSFAKKSVKVYQTRMQIEESFRYMKSTEFGLGFEHNHTKKLARMALLVLLTTLTVMVLILLGKVIELSGLAYRFQSSSTRKRRRLSHFFLGKRALSTNLKITLKQWREGIREFAEQLFKGEGLWLKFVEIPQGLRPSLVDFAYLLCLKVMAIIRFGYFPMTKKDIGYENKSN
ncbi:transposase [Marinomonas sp. C1424]|uniref:Transposase n=1 Tax=Marinomonas transparens TaxID=2795388 RepID=A0A934N106_9GAMM|nr:transposase [Marinomonas transparens]